MARKKGEAAGDGKLARVMDAAEALGAAIGAAAAYEKRTYEQLMAQAGEGAAQGKMDAKAMRDLSASLKDLTAVMRNLYDLPTAQEAAAMDIARARLELDVRKAEEAQEVGDGGIVELAGVVDAGE